jgi:phosphogluconate dehydratase
MNKSILNITNRIIEKSKASRYNYLFQMNEALNDSVNRTSLSCGNLAHAFAGCDLHDKDSLKGDAKVNIGIVSSYNDMLSAHKTYETYPDLIRDQASKIGAVAQVAACVPAMCDGVTQGQKGMELSLISRDVIAMSTAIGMSHNMFDAGLCLGICDKIVPGLLIGALKFGHLPFAFVPGGPMPSGISNVEKNRIRQEYAKGNISKKELLEGESASYHSAGTCTFYGTANSNQMLMEIMGLHLPGSSFVAPNTSLRKALTLESVRQVKNNATNKSGLLKDVINEKSVVNGIVGLLATGGSTNLTLHIIAIAAAAGIKIDWQDFSDLSDTVPLLTRVYPNGSSDVNDFHNAGGMTVLINELLNGGFLNEDVETLVGKGLKEYTKFPTFENNQFKFQDKELKSGNDDIIATHGKPFSQNGGIKVLKGNLGTSVIKTSAVEEANWYVKAEAIVIQEQNQLTELFQSGKLNKDFVLVVSNQGPKSNGMPELHQLTPILSILQHQGHKVALLTDGRMSGASGKIPAAIHLSPEAVDKGPISKILDGDIIELDPKNSSLNILVNEEKLLKRKSIIVSRKKFGMGTELFSMVRPLMSSSKEGASFLNYE